MTAENDGTGAPSEGDDPFAYLYRQDGDEGSAAPQSGGAGGPGGPGSGGPRRSYNQVRVVGERQYGGAGGAGTQQTAAYGRQTNAHYAAPETMPGGRAAAQQHRGDGDGGGNRRGSGPGGGGSRNGLLIGALAVVAAVVIGIAAAIYFNDSGEKDSQRNGAAADAAAGADGGKSQQQPGNKQPPKGKPLGKKQDAAKLRLAGGAAAASDIKGAASSDGSYVGSMNITGASATWTTGNVSKPGAYTLYVRYGVPGKDADSTLTVNGRPSSQPLNMSNFGNAEEGDWEKGWTRTYAYVDLKQGANTLKISCETGNSCDFNLDQVWLKAGKVG